MAQEPQAARWGRHWNTGVGPYGRVGAGVFPIPADFAPVQPSAEPPEPPEGGDGDP